MKDFVYKNVIRKTTTREKVLLFVTFILMVTMLLWFNIFLPKIEENKKLTVELEKLLEKNSNLKNKNINLDKILDNIEEDYNYYDTILPDEKNIERTLIDLEELIKSNNVTIETIQISYNNFSDTVIDDYIDIDSEVEYEEEYKPDEFNIDLKLAGNTLDILSFTENLENFDRIHTINSIRFENSMIGKNERLITNFNLTFYWDGINK
ncbi:type 4a pilus biogenesis protein PilO [Natranaerofaba carboxydovora]|uniref:type 4a pilus biogenesis protein PilO n=1 Tax=Natranaerofaba carboxydovora TaxID=2742683 RepID=UPI001F13ADBE|nr:type 4a pilus biogenesis protein PilO [Natranaerofaba carboxydovora]UMZ73980.1 Pilus assembly protein, PilO [Natranaerofaba carboxydovora]